MTQFTVAVDKFVFKTNEKLNALWRMSLQDTYEFILDFWPVDTGFSRASFRVSSSGFSPIINVTPQRGVQYDPPDYVFVIAGTRFGDRLYANFTADYAKYVEYGANGRPGVGVIRRAAMYWPQVVNTNAQRLMNG